MNNIVTLLLLGLMVFSCSCSTVKGNKTNKISVILDNSEKTSVTVLREFSVEEYKKAKRSLKLIELIIPNLTYTNLPALFWMDSKVFDGLTITQRFGPKYILIDKNFQFDDREFKNNNYNYFKFGAILAHEVIGHAERNLNEPDTRELVDKRIADIVFNKPELIENTEVPK